MMRSLVLSTHVHSIKQAVAMWRLTYKEPPMPLEKVRDEIYRDAVDQVRNTVPGCKLLRKTDKTAAAYGGPETTTFDHHVDGVVLARAVHKFRAGRTWTMDHYVDQDAIEKVSTR